MIEGLALHNILSSSSSFLQVYSMGQGKIIRALLLTCGQNCGTLMSSPFGFGIEFQVSSPSLNLVSSDLEILQVSMLGLMFTIIAKESGTILGTLI